MGEKVYRINSRKGNEKLSAGGVREIIASEHYLDVVGVSVSCLWCGNTISGDRSRWEADLSGMASHLGWRLEIEAGICECDVHRTDIPKKYSFDMSGNPENFYRTYLHVLGFFSLKETPYLLSRLKPWQGGWEYDRHTPFLKEEMSSTTTEVLPEGQYLELHLVRNSKMYPNYDGVFCIKKGLPKS